MKLPTDLQIDRIEESPVLTFDENEVGREAFVFLKGEAQPIGGGLGKTAEEARTIAIAETIERHLVLSILRSEDRKEIEYFGLDKNSSSSGFAYGFDRQAVAFRALCEAYEHHVRYHALYCGKQMPEATLCPEAVNTDQILSAISTEFSSLLIFNRVESVNLGNGYGMKLQASVLVGTHDKGAFVGASAGPDVDFVPAIKHCLVEAWRNKRIYLKNKDLDPKELTSVRRRNIYFGKRKTEALSQINSSTEPWPDPSISIFVSKYYPELGGYLARAVINDCKPWSDLTETRLI